MIRYPSNVGLRGLFAVASIAIAIVGACSSFDDTASPATTNDAAPDSPSDIDSRDAGAAVDGCVPDAHLLCEDFASDKLPSPEWTTISVGAPGGMALVTDRFVSAPRALRVDIAPDAATVGQAILSKKLPPTLRTLSCSFSLYPEMLTSDTSQFSGFFNFSLQGNLASGLQEFVVRLGLLANGSILLVSANYSDGGSAEYASSGASPIQLQGWNRIRIDISLDTRAITITDNGLTLFSVTSSTNVSAHNGGTVFFGISDVSRETHAVIDDIVCD